MIAKDSIEKLFSEYDSNVNVLDVRSFGSGLYNHVFMVAAQDCKNAKEIKQYVLRIAPPEEVPKLFYEKLMMRSEPGIHKMVLENTDVPAPEVYFYDFSRKMIDTDYLIMKLMPGRSGYFSRKELGGYVRQLHDTKGTEFGYTDRGLKKYSTWKETFMEYVKNIVTTQV